MSKKQPSIRDSLMFRVAFFGLLFSAVLTLIAVPLLSYEWSRHRSIVLVIVAVIIAVSFLISIIYSMSTLLRQEAEVEADKHIIRALRKMESVGGFYSDEESANQQLCLLLKELMPGTDVQLVKPGRASEGKGDIRVGDTIIEGKLDLETKDEMDRLVGQIQDYCSTDKKVGYKKLTSLPQDYSSFTSEDADIALNETVSFITKFLDLLKGKIPEDKLKAWRPTEL